MRRRKSLWSSRSHPSSFFLLFLSLLQTYGDAAKTKTISRRKSERIAKILRGEDRSNGADSSKFRFWVRAKGFRLGKGDDDNSSDVGGGNGNNADDPQDLYVVTSTAKVSWSLPPSHPAAASPSKWAEAQHVES